MKERGEPAQEDREGPEEEGEPSRPGEGARPYREATGVPQSGDLQSQGLRADAGRQQAVEAFLARDAERNAKFARGQAHISRAVHALRRKKSAGEREFTRIVVWTVVIAALVACVVCLGGGYP